MPKSKTVFICQECGRQSHSWLGKCPGCQSWNTIVETTLVKKPRSDGSHRGSTPPEALSVATGMAEVRFSTGIGEFDRVLGGGIVPGCLVLIGGEPGIGKSTLLLQAAANISDRTGRVVYISGEETLNQVRLRASRLGLAADNLYLMAETDLELGLEQALSLGPSMLVVDSIQSVYSARLDTLPGSLNQLRMGTQVLMNWAKSNGCPVFITGHVTKDGTLAGPRALEHIVDAVLYLEGEPLQAYRLLRSVKNRFGSTNEVGIFEMRSNGLGEVTNPSHIFLSDRQGGTIGTAVVPTMEGSRSLLVEVQALTSPTIMGQPRRVANGVDFGRLLMITAVLGRRCGLKLGNQDVIVNATGGMRIFEPAADLAIALAIASSFKDRPLDPSLAAAGEVGLSGELRAVSRLDRRLAEAARIGFKRAVVPQRGLKNIHRADGISLTGASTLLEAINTALKAGAG